MPALIWDFDNTLGARSGAWPGALLDALNHYGIQHAETLETIRPYLQHGYPWHTPERVLETPKSYRQWWDDLGQTVFYPYFVSLDEVDDHLAMELARSIDRFYLASMNWVLFDRAIDVLSCTLEMGFEHVMLTNNAAGIEQVLSDLEIMDMFSLVVNSANTGAEKPHPQAFSPILQHYRMNEIAFLIGDSISADVGGAHAIGIASILVGKTSDLASFCVDRLEQVTTILESALP